MPCRRADAEVVRDVADVLAWLQHRHRAPDRLWLQLLRVVRGEPDLFARVHAVHEGADLRALRRDLDLAPRALGYRNMVPEDGPVRVAEVQGARELVEPTSAHRRLAGIARVRRAVAAHQGTSPR